MKAFLTAAVIVGVAVACGPLEDAFRRKGSCADPHKDAPRAVQTWQGSQLLAANKAAVVSAAHAEGASDAHIALLLAVVMQESVDSDASQRDASKDSQGDAANYSAFNVNKAYLKKVGWQEGQGPDLNDQKNVGEAVKWVLAGFRQLGEDGFLNFHRGGESGFYNEQLYGCIPYRQQIRMVQEYLLQHRDAWTNGQRLGDHVDHV